MSGESDVTGRTSACPLHTVALRVAAIPWVPTTEQRKERTAGVTNRNENFMSVAVGDREQA